MKKKQEYPRIIIKPIPPPPQPPKEGNYWYMYYILQISI
jgi:hypothetical protein